MNELKFRDQIYSNFRGRIFETESFVTPGGRTMGRLLKCYFNPQKNSVEYSNKKFDEYSWSIWLGIPKKELDNEKVFITELKQKLQHAMGLSGYPDWPFEFKAVDLRTFNAVPPYLDGDEQSVECFKGYWILKAKQRVLIAEDSPSPKNPIVLQNRDGTRIINANEYFYAGAYARARLCPRTWTNPKSKQVGISYQLLALQFLDHGDPMDEFKISTQDKMIEAYETSVDNVLDIDNL
jgi:hypothetical protein